MTDVHTRNRDNSVLRLLWRATMPEALVIMLPFLIILVVQAWLLWRDADRTLWTIASRLRLPVFMLGSWIIGVAFMGDQEGRPKWARWFGLKPADKREPLADPGTLVVAQPIVTGLGAACLGFALGLNLIVWFAPAAPLAEPPQLTIWMGLCITVVLTIALFRVTNSTRRLYDWSMNVAASAATAQADADAARIAALQAQMNPHFLFNALNTIASLVGADGARSQRTVQNLTGMLKHTLERSSKPLTTVDDEIQFVRDYLDIERERFGSRLQVTYAVDPAIGTMPVPTMSLQPLVENAIKHAVASRLEGGHIRIKAARRLDRPAIRLTVEDDGPGFGPDTPDGTGLGNLRARLHTLYGSDAMLLTETLPQGARVTVTVPISADAWLPCAS